MSSDFYNRIANILSCNDVIQKLNDVHQLEKDFLAGKICPYPSNDLTDITLPGLPAKLKLVDPKAVARRRLGTNKGMIALVHAIAHIEFNAIHLALDAAYRFRNMPFDFYRDWLQVAREEAEHFNLLNHQLQRLNHEYGDLPAHNGLWEACIKTAHDPLIRMALVPRVLEARGLDVTPHLIKKLQAQQAVEIVACLEIILREEERHVTIGNRWFQYLCQLRQVDPEITFFQLLDEYGHSPLQGPFNLDARQRAGFTPQELQRLLANAPYTSNH